MLALYVKELCVAAAPGGQGLGAPLLSDAALFQEQDAVAEPGGGQPVGDEQGGLAPGHPAVLPVDVLLGDGVQGGGVLVQQEDGSVLI